MPLDTWKCTECKSNGNTTEYCWYCGGMKMMSFLSTKNRISKKKAVKKRAPRKKKEVVKPLGYIVPDHFEFNREG